MQPNAAILVLHEKTTNSLILTKRSHQLRHHPGEICFPGGRWQADDNTLYDTALRELHEELGISADRVQLQKIMMTELTLTGYLIQPWFAVITTLDPYQIDQEEVVDVLRLPMSEVCNRDNYLTIWINIKHFTIKTCRYKDNEHFIWGATARIMRQLCR